MNAITLLKEDHRALKKLVSELEQTTSNAVKTRQELFKKIKHEASIHEKAEEKFLYPLLKEHKNSRPEAFEHTEEVNIMNILLSDLGTLSVDSEEWMAKFTVLKEITDHHIKEEENEIFPKASNLLSAEQLSACGNDILAFKEENKL